MTIEKNKARENDRISGISLTLFYEKREVEEQGIQVKPDKQTSALALSSTH